MAPSTLTSVLHSAVELEKHTRVSGPIPSAYALLVARYFKAFNLSQKEKRPVIVICPNDEIATEFSSDVVCLSASFDSFQPNVSQFPTWDQSAYTSIHLPLKTRLIRLATLSGLAHPDANERPDLIFTSIAGLCQSTLPQSHFQKLSISLQIQADVESRENVIFRLLEAGYLRVDPVEDPGTFAIRGDIIDIFPPGMTRPLRIELFDTCVEKIREYDPSTQRTLTSELSIQKVTLPPAREVLINSFTSSLLRERLKERCDDLGISRLIRDPTLEAIRNGNYPEHADAWAAFAYDTPSTLLDYLPNHYAVIWHDELSCYQEWLKFQSLQKELSEKTSSAGTLCPSVESLYNWTTQLEDSLKKKSHLFLDRLDLTDLATLEDRTLSAKFQFVVKSNSELLRGDRHSLGELEPQLRTWIKQNFLILALASTQSQVERIRFLLEERQIPCQIEGTLSPSRVTLHRGTLTEGFSWPSEKWVVLTESEILGTKHLSKQPRQTSKNKTAAQDWSGLQALSDLQIGDTIVHQDHGIGRYRGLCRLNLSGAPGDFLTLEYANKDKLYLPIYRLNVIQKYLGAGESTALDRLGSQHFARVKEKVKNNVRKLAFDLVQLYAERKLHAGVKFSPRDTAFREFEARFQFDETIDQLKAIDAVLSDMEEGRMMDRLVCGDVGYGKTEVAIRAAFRAVSDGKQVAVLVPTTLLAQQHELSFKARLKDYPIIIESVSRFKSQKEQQAILDALYKGRVDIVIGTHRLLSKDVRFQDLGLVVVDEEHRFGVEHKERLKTLKINTHVLTLTATPIPRTLHMALSGLRDISLINTPPLDRLPIRTYVSRYDDALIQRAIEFEISRGGQVFFLHNRVQSINKVANRIRELVPTSQVIVAHGQMSDTELENTMLAFYQKEANVLVCTTIIESGLDIPSSNTIIINRADSLGLAQLYQIRGRVGRGQVRAYAYLLIPPDTEITDDAKKRLEVIQRFVELGSGFSIASHDLEIRGGGDLLGADQSGSIGAVGFDLYTQLLEEAIQDLQGKPPIEVHSEPEIKAPFPAFLSEDFVPDVHQRLSLYRRFSAASQDTEVDQMEEELRDRFGNLPVEAQNLLWLIRIKILLKNIGISVLTVGPDRVSLLPGAVNRLDPIRTIELISTDRQRYQLTPDSKFVAKIPAGSIRDLFFALESLFKSLVSPQQN